MTDETLVKTDVYPTFVTDLFREIDTLNFASGFDSLSADTVMIFGTATIVGVESIKSFFVKIDEPLDVVHRINEFWEGGSTKILRGEAELRTAGTQDDLITTPFMHIFRMTEDLVHVREWFIVNGPINTDSVI